MSLITIAAVPVEAVLPVASAFAGSVVNVARPLGGMSALFAFLMVFKPLLRGLLRAAVLTVVPRLSLEERKVRRVRRAWAPNMMARDFDPSLPALASRG